ncbi:MAG: hypothetical protein ACE5FN_03590 [Leptospirillia bacterium]
MPGATKLTAALPVQVQMGQMPRLWRGSALFFGDLYAIFYGEPEKTRQLQESVSGFFGYGGRLIPMLDLLYQGADNVLILQEHPNPEALAFFSERLGLSLPDIHVLDHRDYQNFGEGLARNPALSDLLKTHPATDIDGYVTDPQLERIAATLNKTVVNSYKESRDANDKVALFRFLGEAGLPMFDGGEVPPSELEDALNALADKGYAKAAVRSSLGASGFGVATLDLDPTHPSDLFTALPGHMLMEERLMVQGWVEPGNRNVKTVTSPSVQFFTDGNGITLFDLTGQLLRHAAIHEGNVAPPLDLPGDSGVVNELIEQSKEVVQWVASTGYRGTGSIDYLVYERGKQVEVRVCEVNARVTGATYPALLARHFLPGKAWLMRNFGFEPEMGCGGLIDFLESENQLFVPGRREGVLPLNFICDGDGRVVKAQLLFLGGRPERCAEMLGRLSHLFPEHARYERD